ncbi:hypothetical protein CFS9_25000 [Flavobacterium sp. CFS9]|uniref:Peptidase C39-like domain-containing protein n=1 Tax=Flavobacterium sp. CFS9 TaxID=3143118 RepID=A0AAT9H265_9FLAO
MKKLFKYALAFVFLALTSCEKDSNEPHQTKTESSVPFEKKLINANELPADIQQYINTDETKNSSKSGNTETLNEPIFMMYDIVSMTDDKSVTNYSISFFYPDTPENVYYNLVINVLPTGESKKYVFKYICNPEDYENFKAHHFNFKYFDGTTEISQVSYNTTGKFTSKSSAGDDPCAKIFIPSSSDPKSNPAAGGGSGGGGNLPSGGFNTSVPGYNSPPSSGGYKGGGDGSSGHDHSNCYGSNGQYWYYAGDVRPPHPHTSKSAAPCPEVTPPTGYVPVNTMPLIKTLGTQLSLSKDQIAFLRNRPDTMNIIGSYLNSNNFSDEAKSFCNWAINYLMQNPNVTIHQFKNWFMGTSEGQDGEYIDPNLIYYETPLTKQELPSLSQWLTNFPKIELNGYWYSMSSAEVYKLVGGSLYNSSINEQTKNQYTNACAIRGSRALLYSGITIPVLKYGKPPLQVTQKGGDNLNYILSASSFNKFMIDKFGETKDKLEGDNANDATKVANLLQGKSGIYVIINKNPGKNGAGYSGHVDAIVNGMCISNAYTQPKGGVQSIRIWSLN